jgi:hypothetical protein
LKSKSMMREACSFFEPFKVLDPRLSDELAHRREIFGTLRELLGPDGDEFLGRNAEVLSGSKIGSLENVEGEKGVNTVNHIVGGVTSSLADGNTLGPEHERENLTPLRLVTFAGLHHGFANVEMLGLDDAIRAGVVARDADVSNAIASSDKVEGSDVSGTVVSD